MNGDEDSKISYVTSDGRTIVNARALLRDPRVKETIRRLSKDEPHHRGRRGITFLTPRKDD